MAHSEVIHVRGGWGFVARDATGVVLGSGAGHIQHASSAIVSEAAACGEALMATVQWGMGNIILETNALNLVKALTSTNYDLAPEGIIYRDLRSFLYLNFVSVKVVFVPRSCNKVAHEIAALGASQQDVRKLWMNTVPDAVSLVLASKFASPV
jgi:ribonuclease HI